MDRINCFCGGLCYVKDLRSHLYTVHEIKMSKEKHAKIINIVHQIPNSVTHIPQFIAWRMQVETFAQTKISDI